MGEDDSLDDSDSVVLFMYSIVSKAVMGEEVRIVEVWVYNNLQKM